MCVQSSPGSQASVLKTRGAITCLCDPQKGPHLFAPLIFLYTQHYPSPHSKEKPKKKNLKFSRVYTNPPTPPNLSQVLMTQEFFFLLFCSFVQNPQNKYKKGEGKGKKKNLNNAPKKHNKKPQKKNPEAKKKGGVKRGWGGGKGNKHYLRTAYNRIQ